MIRTAINRLPLTLSLAISRQVQFSGQILCKRTFPQLELAQRFLHVKTYDKEVKRDEHAEVRYQKESVQNTQFPLGDDKSLLKGDPNVFGSGVEGDDDVELEDIKDEEERNVRPKRSQKMTLKQYSFIIKEHLNQKRIKEAVDVLEERMLKDDKVKPDTYIYNLLISGCAKAGFSKKAFQLYNKMKQRGLRVTGGTYTSLFNACSQSPWAEDGLNKAVHLREIMAEKGYTPNVLNYNAMIKAFGRCGDVKTAFQLADEMIEKKLAVNAETFNFLLQACASQNEYGFRHALLTWHKMRLRKVVPDIYSFSLMLRCVRDCSIGDVETMNEVLDHILINPQNKLAQIEASSTGEEHPLVVATPSTEVLDETPNLLSTNPHLGSLVAISEIVKPEDRLLLLGGFPGFLEEMKKCSITPGIETFTSLLEVIPSTLAAEKKLIATIRKIGLKSDIDFFNVLIKKRSMRFDYDAAKEVLTMIKTAKLQPDIVTYGVLSLSCRTQEEARELLLEMRSKGIRMNIQILGAMLRQGCAQRNFAYVIEVLQLTLDERIKPNEAFLAHLDKFIKECSLLKNKQYILAKDKHFKHDFNRFIQKSNIWYEEQNIAGLQLSDAVKKIKESPFKQFQQKQPEGFEDTKNEQFARKQKIRKYIKKIKMRDLNEIEPSAKSSNKDDNVVV